MRNLLGVCVLIVAVAFVGLAAAGGPKILGSQSAAGDYAIAQASGTASHPHQVMVRVIASPPQAVSGAWSLVCSKGFGAGTKSGQVKGRAPFTQLLKLPMKNSDRCIVSANAQLSRSGKITVQVLSQ